MKNFVKQRKESLAVTWNDLAVIVTDHMLAGQSKCRWKQLEADSNDPHVITLNNGLGLACAHDQLQHVKENGDDIREAVVEQLRLKYRKITGH